MPRLVERNPKYRLHKASGQALVTIDGKDNYLGPHGSAASRREYDRLVSEWLANGRRAPASQSDMKIMELLAAFLRHARQHYRRPDGTPTSEVDNMLDVMAVLKRLYGHTPITEYGPLALKATRQEMIKAGWCRTNINRQIARIKHIFKWGVENEIVPAHVHQGLAAVAGLRAGRSDAKESEPVQPVAEAHWRAILDYASPPVAAMVELQAITGMRPGEVIAMRGIDLDTSEDLWIYKPGTHKTQHHGHERIVYLGPRAKEIIEKFLRPSPHEHLFRPVESRQWHWSNRPRTTKPSCGNVAGSNVAKKPMKSPGECYTVESYGRAIDYACDAAFPPPAELARKRVQARGRKAKAQRWETPVEWKARLVKGKKWDDLRKWWKEHRFHPHQLRHAAATVLRKQYGLEAAQVILGHKTLTVTQVYAQKNVDAAREIVAKIG